MENISKKADLFFRKLKSLPFVLLGDKMKERKEQYRDLRMSMKRARIPMSYEMYISNAIFYSTITGLIGAILGLILAYIVTTVAKLPDRLTHLTFSPSTAWLLEYRNISIAIFIVIFLTLLFGGITYVLFLIYPAFMAVKEKGILIKSALCGNFYVCIEQRRHECDRDHAFS